MKNVLITGGSRGIGAAIVRKFTSNGYSVAFTYKNSKEKAEELAKETGAYAIHADSESESEILTAVRTARERIGKLDILINNAGISSSGIITDLSTEEWERMFRVNVTSAFIYSKACIPDMVRQSKGRIINISSIWGITGASCEVSYSATKAALIGFTKALAKELAPMKITVNAVAPGMINTDMNSSLSEMEIAMFCEDIPTMRVGEPAEVADAVFFLAGEEAAYITGDVLNVNGGYLT